MAFSAYFFLQSRQKSWIKKSRRTHALQNPTSKRYIVSALIATTHRQRKNLFLSNPGVQILAKSNKTRVNFNFICDPTSLTDEITQWSFIATEKHKHNTSGRFGQKKVELLPES